MNIFCFDLVTENLILLYIVGYKYQDITITTINKTIRHPCLRADKGIARHVDASSVLCTLID